jgi:hypothetical protein
MFSFYYKFVSKCDLSRTSPALSMAALRFSSFLFTIPGSCDGSAFLFTRVMQDGCQG